MSSPSRNAEKGDRRAGRRYAIELAVAYRILRGGGFGETGAGISTDISSHGIRFQADRTFPPGTHLEVSVSWPMLLDNRCALQLHLSGRIVRSDAAGVAVEISQHEFRTRRSGAEHRQAPQDRTPPEPALTAVGFTR